MYVYIYVCIYIYIYIYIYYVRHSDEISRMSQIPITLHEPINKCGFIRTILIFWYYLY